MKTETTMFFEHVLRENRPVSDFLNANYTFLNERLATHYGIEGVTGSGVPPRGADDRSPRRRVEPGCGAHRLELSDAHVAGDSRQVRPAESPRHASAAASRRRPVARGVGRGRVAKSVREQLEVHRANPTCASCHRNMDPLGFGLENYDAIGRWRDTDGEFPVDASGTLPSGQRFTHGRGDAGAPAVTIAPVLAYFDREDADLRAAAGPQAVRSADGRRTSIAPLQPTATTSGPWFIRS